MTRLILLALLLLACAVALAGSWLDDPRWMVGYAEQPETTTAACWSWEVRTETLSTWRTYIDGVDSLSCYVDHYSVYFWLYATEVTPEATRYWRVCRVEPAERP